MRNQVVHLNSLDIYLSRKNGILHCSSMVERECTIGRKTLTMKPEDDPQRLFEAESAKPEEQRARHLFLDARDVTEEQVRAWLDRCAAIPGFLEGSSAEWLIEEMTVIGNESMRGGKDIDLIRTGTRDRQELVASLLITLAPEDDVEEFLNEQQRLPAEARSKSVLFDARGISMESIERWIGFFYQFCDAHAEHVGEDAYEPATIVVLSQHEEPEICSGVEQLQWIQTSSEEEQE